MRATMTPMGGRAHIGSGVSSMLKSYRHRRIPLVLPLRCKPLRQDDGSSQAHPAENAFHPMCLLNRSFVIESTPLRRTIAGAARPSALLDRSHIEVQRQFSPRAAVVSAPTRPIGA
jgi:hypothetical protein